MRSTAGVRPVVPAKVLAQAWRGCTEFRETVAALELQQGRQELRHLTLPSPLQADPQNGPADLLARIPRR